MVYEQCLCCFRFNAEIWLSYARFEADGKGAGTGTGEVGAGGGEGGVGGVDNAPASAPASMYGSGTAPTSTSTTTTAPALEPASLSRAIYLEGIDANPSITLLRIGM
jgi:hypothetical protein